MSHEAKAEMPHAAEPLQALPIAIVGAGIGGLTLAAGLKQAGIPCVLLERSPELRPVGAGLAVQLNALAALDRIGLAEAVQAAGQATEAAVVATAQGRVLSRVPMGALQAEHQGRLPIALHRASLHRVLLHAIEPGSLRLGQSLVALHETEDQVRLELADGSHLAARLVVGADGLRSVVRRHLRGEEPLRYAGYTSWRGVCPRPAGVAQTAHEWWGRGLRFGHAPIDAERSYWYATANAPVDEHDGPDPRAELLLRFAAFAEPIPTLLKATPHGAIVRTDVHDRPPIEAWSRGRIVLLGDAAHPMTPNLGQGACQAIEDAVALAEELASDHDHSVAFAVYEARRVARANALVVASWRLGAVGQWAKPLACTLRDWAMAATPTSVLLRQVRESSQPS